MPIVFMTSVLLAGGECGCLAHRKSIAPHAMKGRESAAHKATLFIFSGPRCSREQPAGNSPYALLWVNAYLGNSLLVFPFTT